MRVRNSRIDIVDLRHIPVDVSYPDWYLLFVGVHLSVNSALSGGHVQAFKSSERLAIIGQPSLGFLLDRPGPLVCLIKVIESAPSPLTHSGSS